LRTNLLRLLAGTTSLPAGDYRVLSTDNGLSVTIQQLDGSSLATVSAFVGRVDKALSAPKLIFHRYGERYFLSQVTEAAKPRLIARALKRRSSWQHPKT